MSETHNKLQYRNNYNHWKILGLVLDLNYFSFSNLVSSEISDFTPSAHAQSNILHFNYAEKTDD